MSSIERTTGKRPGASRGTWYAASASDHVPITDENAHEVGEAVRTVIKRGGKSRKRGAKITTVNVAKSNTKDLAQPLAAKLKAEGKAMGVKGDFEFVTLKLR